MTDTATMIAERLESCFVQRGFQEPGVDALRDAASVSLRTLYKYFPSREEMVIGALNHRHGRYLEFIERDLPNDGPAAVDQIFSQIGDWMAGECGAGCLFLNALAAHPDHPEIRQVVARQKDETRALLGRCSGRPELSDALFLLHEGATAAWPLMGEQAIETARASAKKLLTNS